MATNGLLQFLFFSWRREVAGALHLLANQLASPTPDHPSVSFATIHEHGVARIPQSAMSTVALPFGGRVAFVSRSGAAVVEMMSEATYRRFKAEAQLASHAKAPSAEALPNGRQAQGESDHRPPGESPASAPWRRSGWTVFEKVTPEGLMQLPAQVRYALGVPMGGWLAFFEGVDGQLVVVSKDTYRARFGLGCDDF